ncbi:hypothetical protein LguiA_036385 [Lonicera macranthoides]
MRVLLAFIQYKERCLTTVKNDLTINHEGVRIPTGSPITPGRGACALASGFEGSESPL